MTDEPPLVSETAIGVEIFRPLWALVTIGALAGAHASGRGEFSLTEYVTARRADLDSLLDLIQRIGRISPATMNIAEAQGGWSDGRVVPIGDIGGELLIYAGFVEEYPPDLCDAVVLGRLLGAATDLQLTTLLDGLVGAAVASQADPATVAPRIVDAVRGAAVLAQAVHGPAPAEVFRLWRVAFVPSALRPDSHTPALVRAGLRRYVRALEETVLAAS